MQEDKQLRRPVAESETLTSERTLSDEAIARERTRVDQAIQTKDEIEKYLRDERQETDDRFFEERNTSDKKAHRASSRLSNELLAHEKTKAALTTRDEFLAIVSHDLRNPIGSISSCAEMLLDDDPDLPLEPRLRQWVQLIKRNADSALNLIGDLLDMERITQGQLRLERGKHSLNRIIRESVQDLSAKAVAHGILLSAKLPSETLEAECDRDRILQVLSNLIGNAIKFTPAGGQISVSARRDRSEMVVDVTDNGPGIPSEKQHQIFERFAQLGNRDRRGLGLGLYISKMLLEAHMGRISVRSEPGAGSTFTFVIPASIVT